MPNIIYNKFKKTLVSKYGKDKAAQIWKQIKCEEKSIRKNHPEIKGDSKMMIIPTAAIYTVLRKQDKTDALPMLCTYGKETGIRIAKMIHGFTSIPGIPKLLWRNMPSLMRKMSSEKAGYTRRIVSETNELVGVDILSCPLHDAAKALGMPEIAQVVCAMDKEYMKGFRHIDYTRTTSVAEGNECCDYRLRYNKSKTGGAK